MNSTATRQIYALADERRLAPFDVTKLLQFQALVAEAEKLIGRDGVVRLLEFLGYQIASPE